MRGFPGENLVPVRLIPHACSARKCICIYICVYIVQYQTKQTYVMYQVYLTFTTPRMLSRIAGDLCMTILHICTYKLDIFNVYHVHQKSPTHCMLSRIASKAISLNAQGSSYIQENCTQLCTITIVTFKRIIIRIYSIHIYRYYTYITNALYAKQHSR